MSSKIAHTIEEKERTKDVCFKESAPFSKMLLKEGVKKGLDNCGFVYPTVIQSNAIPIGKAGIDLLCQSKSGTGKTLIFCTILLEQYQEMIREPQSLILVPTREIAIQIEGILNEVGALLPDFRAITVIGGLEVNNDRKKLASAKAVVGTPGRVLHLIQNEMLNTSKISLFILDEADKMMSRSFLSDFQKINRSLSKKKQMLACSATFCDDLDKKIATYMRNPLLVSTDKGATLLIGIKQFVYDIPEEKTSILEMCAKLRALKILLGRIPFKQCLAFASSQSRAESYKHALEKDDWPCEVITGGQDQKTRIEVFRKFKQFETRILISTDLMARGIDSENVNLVLNIEPADDSPTYLHRIGRAGRFGSHGIAVTFIASQGEQEKFEDITKSVGSGLNIYKYPSNQSIDIWNFVKQDEENYLEIYNFDEIHAKKIFDAEKENVNGLNTPCNSACIDSKTYKIEYIDHDANANKILLTETMSSLQRLPSSNTIDDASSIAVDSDVLRSNSIESRDLTVKKRPSNNSMSLLEVLIDNSKSSSTDKVDLFEDYKSFEGHLNQSMPKTEVTTKLNLKDLLVDTKKPEKAAKDAFSEYEKLKTNGDDMTDSNSYSAVTSPQYEPSVAGTSRIAFEQLNLKIPEADSSQSLHVKLQKQHFPSPNNMDEINAHINVLEPQAGSSSNDSVASNASSSFEDVSTSSSGFDERTTSAKTSGISTSSESEVDSNYNDENGSEEEHYYDNVAEADFDDDDDYGENYEDDEDDEEEDSFDYSNANTDEDDFSDEYTEEQDDEDDETYQESESDADVSNDGCVAPNTSKAFPSNQSKANNSNCGPSQSFNLDDVSNPLNNTSTLCNEQSEEQKQVPLPENDPNVFYQNSYARWTDLYWNQMTQIQDYVKFCTYVRKNSKNL